jgi:hypothetical protein
MSFEAILPPWALAALALGLGMGLAGLGLWVGCKALEKLVRQIRRILASELRLQHLRMQYDREALNYWIRDSFRHKKQAERERRRADQEQYDKRQIAMGAENYMRRCGT